MPAGGGLLQLVANGKQDVFLTGNPQISFFKMVYRRHTNFATESQPMYFDGTANFGQRISCLIPRRGDLLGRIYLEVLLPQLTSPNIIDGSNVPVSYVNSIGNALIQEITFEVGEQEIDRQTGEWMEIWEQMTTPAGQKDALNSMVGRFEGYQVPDLIPGINSPGLLLQIPSPVLFLSESRIVYTPSGPSVPSHSNQYYDQSPSEPVLLPRTPYEFKRHHHGQSGPDHLHDALGGLCLFGRRGTSSLCQPEPRISDRTDPVHPRDFGDSHPEPGDDSDRLQSPHQGVSVCGPPLFHGPGPRVLQLQQSRRE